VPGLLLFSVNPRIRLIAQEWFFGDVHHVWCSENYDSNVLSPYTFASLQGASSNPKDIYNDLRKAVETGDTHNARIVRVRAWYIQKASEEFQHGHFTAEQRDELISLFERAETRLYSPLLYVIPRLPIQDRGRLKLVPPQKRASHGPEYIVEDLRRDEFEIMEP
jgi:hypothetical protein